MSAPASPLLSSSQMAALAAVGEERSAPVGEVLYRVGDRSYPFMAILRGRGRDHRRGRERDDQAWPLGLPRGAEPAVGADGLRQRSSWSSRCATSRSSATTAAASSTRTALSATCSSPRSSPGGRRCRACRGSASRSSAGTGRSRRCGCSSSRARTGFRSPGRMRPRRTAAPRRSCGCPGGGELHGPTTGRGAARSRDRARALTAGGGRSAGRGRRAGGPRGRGLRGLRRARHAGRREHRARRPGGVVPSDRELPRLPGRDQRHRAHKPRRHARRASSTRAPRRRTAPFPSSRETAATSSGSRRPRDRRARRPARDGRPVPAAPGRPPCRVRGPDASSTPPGRPRRSSAPASRVGVVGGGNSAGQAAVWLARGGALVTLLHRRADLRETMSDYLVHELERYGVAVRDRSEIGALHGEDGQLAAVTLEQRRAPSLLLPVPLPRRAAVHRVARRHHRPRPRRLHPHRRRRRTPTTCSRPTCPACSRPATSAPARPNAAPPPSAKARWPSSSCMRISARRPASQLSD